MTLTRRSFTTALTLAPLARASLRSGSAQAGRLSVLATFSILGDVVRNVGGELVALDVLVGPDSDTHTFEPSPDDIAKVADAVLIFENGVAFEPWLGDIYASSESSATRVVVTDGLALRGLDGTTADDENEEAAEDESEDEPKAGEDPHVWHDVKNVIAEVAVVRDALGAADPANAETYAANADAYLARLSELDAFATAEAEKLPVERRRLVTSHDALGYLATYGFEIVGTALGSLSTETADPSGGEIAALVEEIKATGVPAIFAENIEGTDLMGQIADDAGVQLAPPIYTDALGEPGGQAGTYIDMVRYNMTTIVTALGGA